MKTVITKTKIGDNLIKRSVVLYARRYKPAEARCRVEMFTGCGAERLVCSKLSRHEARSLSNSFLGE